MARFTKAIDIWALDQESRAKLQPGQHITAGGAKGRWVGQTRGSDVAAWNDNARRHPLGFHGYWRTLRTYQQGATV